MPKLSSSMFEGGREKGMHVHTHDAGVLASSISFGITIVRWPIQRRICIPVYGAASIYRFNRFSGGEKKRGENERDRWLNCA